MPQFSATSQSRYSPEMTQLFNFGEITTVQERFHALLKQRLKLEYESRPPLFPWETEVREYPAEIPSFATAQAGGYLWLENLRHMKAAQALPESVLTQLLERCQTMVQSSFKQGIKLVRTVEALFPNQEDILEPIANIVLTPAYRSSTDLQEATLQELKNLAGDGYEAATPEQQVALSMLAAQEIMTALSLSVSVRQPRLVREWITVMGVLKLEVVYQSNLLMVQAYLPGGGEMNLLGGDSETRALRSQSGQLTLVQAAPEIGKTYGLEVSLLGSHQRPLRFVVSVSDASGDAGA